MRECVGVGVGVGVGVVVVKSRCYGAYLEVTRGQDKVKQVGRAGEQRRGMRLVCIYCSADQ